MKKGVKNPEFFLQKSKSLGTIELNDKLTTINGLDYENYGNATHWCRSIFGDIVLHHNVYDFGLSCCFTFVSERTILLKKTHRTMKMFVNLINIRLRSIKLV